jgi:hypothetical protein
MTKAHGRYDAPYLSLVKSQNLMDAQMTFASELEVHFNQIPTTTEPASSDIRFESGQITQDVEFEVRLSAESSAHYKMEPLKGKSLFMQNSHCRLKAAITIRLCSSMYTTR